MHWKTSPQHRREPNFHFKSMLMGNVAWAFVYLFNFEVLVLSALMIETYPSAEHLWREGTQEERRKHYNHTHEESRGTNLLNSQSGCSETKCSSQCCVCVWEACHCWKSKCSKPLVSRSHSSCTDRQKALSEDLCYVSCWCSMFIRALSRGIERRRKPTMWEQNRPVAWIGASYSALRIWMCILLKYLF